MEELKNKTAGLILFALLFCIVKNKAQNQTVYTLPQCIDLAVQNNFALTVARSQQENGKARLEQVGASTLPYVNGYANQGINTGKSINPYTNTFIDQEIGTGQYGLNGGITLFNGLSTVNLIHQNASSYRADKMDYEQAKLDLSIQVTQAYLLILTSEELVNQSLFQMELTQVQLDRLSVLDKNNAVTPSILYDTRGQLANDKLNLVNARTTLLNAKIALGQLMNIKLEPNAAFEKMQIEKEMESPLVTFENLVSDLQPKAPSIRSAGYRKTSALKGLQASRGQIFPVLSLNGSLGSNYSSAASTQKITGVNSSQNGSYVSIAGSEYQVYEPRYNYSSEKIPFNNQLKNNLNTYIGLSLQVPIFNSLKTRTQVKQAKISYHQAQEQEKTSGIRFRALIEQTCNDLASAYERYKIYKEQASDYSSSFNIAKTKFEQGSITSIDYMTTKNNFERARIGLILTQYEYILKQKVLELYRQLP